MVDKILVVDDNDLNRKLFRLILEAAGYEVVEAENGMHGVLLVREHLPSLVLMDVQMPVMDGVCALREILADTAIRHVPVVVVTAFAMKGDQERLLKEGFADYLAKPFKREEVLKKVKTILEGRRA